MTTSIRNKLSPPRRSRSTGSRLLARSSSATRVFAVISFLILSASTTLSLSPSKLSSSPFNSKQQRSEDRNKAPNTKFVSEHQPLPSTTSTRRSFFATAFASTTGATASCLLFPIKEAQAGIDPSALKGYSVEGDQSGVQTRMRQIEMEKNRPSDLTNEPFVTLPSGASYREFREGKGDAVVQDGSKVATEMTIRCKSFATANEPGGLKYYATATDTDFNELAWTVGSGALLPELESAMMGMHKNALRRIEVPSTAVYAAKKANQLPLPSPSNKDSNRRFENMFKTDATLLFEVLVTRIK